jgi:hypothetical protein
MLNSRSNAFSTMIGTTNACVSLLAKLDSRSSLRRHLPRSLWILLLALENEMTLLSQYFYCNLLEQL